MDTKEGNKLIAEFMGTKDIGGWITIPSRGWGYQKKHWPNNLKYHTSCDWLMPVVEKIAEMDNQGCFCGEEDYEEIILIHCTSILCHKQAVYQRVIDFITWYNKNK